MATAMAMDLAMDPATAKAMSRNMERAFIYFLYIQKEASDRLYDGDSISIVSRRSAYTLCVDQKVSLFSS